MASPVGTESTAPPRLRPLQITAGEGSAGPSRIRTLRIAGEGPAAQPIPRPPQLAASEGPPATFWHLPLRVAQGVRTPNAEARDPVAGDALLGINVESLQQGLAGRPQLPTVGSGTVQARGSNSGSTAVSLRARPGAGTSNNPSGLAPRRPAMAQELRNTPPLIFEFGRQNLHVDTSFSDLEPSEVYTGDRPRRIARMRAPRRGAHSGPLALTRRSPTTRPPQSAGLAVVPTRRPRSPVQPLLAIEPAPAPTEPPVGPPRPPVSAPGPPLGVPRPSLGAPRPPVSAPGPPLGVPRPSLGAPRPPVGIPRPPVRVPEPLVDLRDQPGSIAELAEEAFVLLEILSRTKPEQMNSEHREIVESAYSTIVKIREQFQAGLSDKETPKEVDSTIVNAACIICYEKIADTVLMPCNHLVLCAECCKKLKTGPRIAQCPICRRDIRQTIAIFRG